MSSRYRRRFMPIAALLIFSACTQPEAGPPAGDESAEAEKRAAAPAPTLVEGPEASSAPMVASQKTESDVFTLKMQKRDPETGERIVFEQPIDPARTALVVIDMWDQHWCKTYTERVAAMVSRLNRTLNAARVLGIQVVHAPSDTMDFYSTDRLCGNVAYHCRQAMLEIPAHPEPPVKAFDPKPEPAGKDRCECGPDRPCTSKGVWTRQNAGIEIAPPDLIGDCNNAREMYNLAAERGIDTLIYVGVASNMCVLHRAFGMLNMRRHGFETFFIADLVQAITANGVDPETLQADWNFTPAKGTAIVQRYLEREVSPSLESRQLIAAAASGMAYQGDPRPHVVFVTAEQEYDTSRTLRLLADAELGGRYRCTFLDACSTEGEGRNDIPGLEALYDADLLVLSARRRALPVTQMDHLEYFIRSGKPLVAIRTSIVPFQVGADQRPAGHVIWHDFDREVLGCHYSGYDSESRQTGSEIRPAANAADHPILSGVGPDGFHSTSWLYNLAPLDDDAVLLLEGRWNENQPVQPVAWTHSYNGGRVFFTSLGHPDDFDGNPAFRRMMANAIGWALGELD